MPISPGAGLSMPVTRPPDGAAGEISDGRAKIIKSTSLAQIFKSADHLKKVHVAEQVPSIKRSLQDDDFITTANVFASSRCHCFTACFIAWTHGAIANSCHGNVNSKTVRGLNFNLLYGGMKDNQLLRRKDRERSVPIFGDDVR